MFSRADVSYIVHPNDERVYNDMTRYGTYLDKDKIFLHLVQGVPESCNQFNVSLNFNGLPQKKLHTLFCVITHLVIRQPVIGFLMGRAFYSTITMNEISHLFTSILCIIKKLDVNFRPH